MPVALEVLDDPAPVCARMMSEVASAGGHIVLTGGSTPKRAYEQLAAATASGDVDLSPATFWFGDERCVPLDDDRSNYLMVKQSLFDAIANDAAPAVHRMEGERGFDEGAEDYERRLRDAGPPDFDLLLLGLGPDGHVASMFPNHPSLSERERLVVGVPEAGFEPYVPRVSMSFPAIALAQHVVFLVAGSEKAKAVAAAFGAAAKPDLDVPASLVPSWARRTTVLLDRDAAAGL